MANDNLGCINEQTCDLDSDSLEFFVIGDIGGLPVYPYYTSAQVKVAESMAKLARDWDIKFVVNVGDNFYFNGVTDVKDERFQTSFENIYSDPSLNLPWYTIAGNHDYNGNIQAQISYTNHSDKWTFPDLYYKFSYKFGSSSKITVEFIMLDTIILCGNFHDVKEKISPYHQRPEGPEDPEAARKQLEWLEKQLAESRADYLFVAGHYPIYSTSGHIPYMLEKIDPLLRKYKVNAYFAGHVHNLQHIKILQPSENDSKISEMNYVISGAGSRMGRSARHIKDLPQDSVLFHYPSGWNPLGQMGFSNGGFVYGKAEKEHVKFKFYTGKLEEKFSMILRPRRL